MNPLIRDARPEDLEAIVAIYNATIPSQTVTSDTQPVSMESRRKWFEAHTPDRWPFWVVEDQDRVVAWFSLFRMLSGEPFIHRSVDISVYVAPTHQRRGLGRLLLQKAIDEAPRLGHTTLVGFIFAHNTPSLSLFHRMGFEPWGSLKGVAELAGQERDLMIVGRRFSLGEKGRSA